jgi:hypothetical protein
MLKKLKLRAKGSYPVQFVSDVFRIYRWVKAGYAPPAPHFVKQRIISTNSIKTGNWIETGTYLGSTTKKLAKHGASVFSIEPQTELYEYNLQRFRNRSNVRLFHGSREECFPAVIKLINSPTNFWLDGHYSGGDTFKGATTTPVLMELDQIALHMNEIGKLAVFVDDVRCFYPGYSSSEDYPHVNFLVEWANALGLNWKIEHDIFIASN